MTSHLQPNSGLSARFAQLLMAILVRNTSVFERFRTDLSVEHFNAEHHQLVYRVLLDHWAENQELPARAELEATVYSYLEEDPEIISDTGQEALAIFFQYAFSADTFTGGPDSVKMERFAFRAGSKLLKHHLAIAVSQQAVLQPENTLDDFFQQAADKAVQFELNSMGSSTHLTFPDNFDKANPLEIQSTGLSFLDSYMGGGAVKGEVYLLMAPYGTCKTTLAVQLWCTDARRNYAAALGSEDETQGISVLITYEAPLSPEIQHRAMMYAATVHRTSLEQMGQEGLDALSNDPEAPKPYEKTRFRDEIASGMFIPERSRIDDIVPIINEHTLCLDFSGADDSVKGSGYGGVAEIVARIKAELRNRGGKHFVSSIHIDYLGLLCDRDETIVASQGAETHVQYQKAVDRIGNQLSKQFGCHTWVLHQLSGQANSIQSPTKSMHHTDAKGSKSVAENADFAFVVGNLSLQQLGQISCTKHRRYHKMAPTIIKVNGEFNEVIAPDNYTVDHRGQIVDENTAGLAGSNQSLPPGPTPGGEGNSDAGSEDPPAVETEHIHEASEEDWGEEHDDI